MLKSHALTHLFINSCFNPSTHSCLFAMYQTKSQTKKSDYDVKNKAKKRVAVFFGGKSPEHDVSVVTGLQILNALDDEHYEGFPVYITAQGEWYIGDILKDKSQYLPSAQTLKQCQKVLLDINAGRAPRLKMAKSSFWGEKAIEFDVALPCFHGAYGEDGNIQGLFEVSGVPYAGMRTMASSICMDKVASKYYMQALGIPTLPFAHIKRPIQGRLVDDEQIIALTKHLSFPCIVKPVHLGSSIGVAKVETSEELSVCLPVIFEQDTAAIVEPFVSNMVEYNVAVGQFSGEIKTSAIEKPKAASELLDFKQKYLSGGNKKTGDDQGSEGAGLKTPGEASEGMLSLTRELNPELSQEMEGNIRRWSTMFFENISGSGAPRIDFISNKETSEIWMNEINPWPGSIGYFLWESAKEPILFTDLLSELIQEAFDLQLRSKLPKDPVPVDARLFGRPS